MKINVSSGNGGSGSTHLHREKFNVHKNFRTQIWKKNYANRVCDVKGWSLLEVSQSFFRGDELPLRFKKS